MKTIIFLLFNFIFCSSAIADQCAWNEKKYVIRAVELAKRLADINGQTASIYHYCEPCGDTRVARVEVKNTKKYGIEISFNDVRKKDTWTASVEPKTFWEVNYTTPKGKTIRTDLAYIFVKFSVRNPVPEAGEKVPESVDRLANLATLVNCPVEGVSVVVEAWDRQKYGADENGARPLEVFRKVVLPDVIFPAE